MPGGQGVGGKGGKVGVEVLESVVVDAPGTGARLVVGFDRSEADPDIATAEADFTRGCFVRDAGCC